jgi:hypothetical protein
MADAPSLALCEVALFPIAFALATLGVARAEGLTSPKRQREGGVDQGGARAALSLALRAGKYCVSRSATSKLALRVRVFGRSGAEAVAGTTVASTGGDP